MAVEAAGPQRRRHDAAPRRLPGAARAAPSDIPGMELAGDVRRGRSGRVPASRSGDRVMAVVGGGGRPSSRSCTSARRSRFPTSMVWPEAGGFPEVFTTAHDALFTQCGLTARRTCAGARRGGRRRDRGSPARRPRRCARRRDRPQRVDSADESSGSAARAATSPSSRPTPISPSTVRSTSCSSSSALRTSPPTSTDLATGGRISIIGVGGGGERRSSISSRSWGSGAGSTGRRCAPARSSRRPPPHSDVEHARPAACSRRDGYGCPSRRPTRWPTPRPPTTGSRPAASSARSSLVSCMIAARMQFAPSLARGRQDVDAGGLLYASTVNGRFASRPINQHDRAVAVGQVAHDARVVHVLRAGASRLPR